MHNFFILTLLFWILCQCLCCWSVKVNKYILFLFYSVCICNVSLTRRELKMSYIIKIAPFLKEEWMKKRKLVLACECCSRQHQGSGYSRTGVNLSNSFVFDSIVSAETVWGAKRLVALTARVFLQLLRREKDVFKGTNMGMALIS